VLWYSSHPLTSNNQHSGILLASLASANQCSGILLISLTFANYCSGILTSLTSANYAQGFFSPVGAPQVSAQVFFSQVPPQPTST
jgi:hypothetical protein